MSKALLMSCPEGVDGEEDGGDATGKVRNLAILLLVHRAPPGSARKRMC